MMNVEFEGARPIGKPSTMKDEDCSSAWAMPFEQEIDMVVDPMGTTVKEVLQCWLMCYQPSKEDIEAIQRGEPIWLKIMAEGLPPHALFTMDPDTNKPNV